MVQQFPGLTVDVTSIPSHPAYPTPDSLLELFPNALGDDSQFKIAATTIRETRWQEMMNQITDKPDWNRKIHDTTIKANWRREILEQGQESSQGFSDAMADGLIAELVQKAEEYKSSGWIVAYDPGVLKSDVAVSDELKHALRSAVSPLENVPESAKDWHPGSNGQVLDIVHPSLWPLMYGITKMLDTDLECDDDPIADIGVGNILPAVTVGADDWAYSNHFQWLPADMQYNEKKEPKFASYINNLHPQRYKGLYEVIEKIVDAAIPLWGRTLNSWPIKQRIVFDKIEYRDLPKMERLPDETDDDYDDRVDEEQWELRPDYVIQPEPHGNEIKYESIDLKTRFHAGLQVIVKLANIHLRPGQSYTGGSWHVEGQANEHIVATALYYYDCENITESRLAFRQSSDEEEFNYDSEWHEDFSYEQSDHAFLTAVYGLTNDESTIQDIGSVVCKEGRLLTFPNSLQHRVSPFDLVDKAKPGHRKILALFLVDPHLKIISTLNVPPQQKHWWIERILQTKGISFLEKLPPELINHILSFVDEPMSFETAKDKRLELIAERSRYVQAQDEYFTEGSYNLCEH